MTLEEIKEYDFKKVNHDQNGNPRYVIHFLAFITNRDRENIKNSPGGYDVSRLYELAIKRANKIGGRKFNNKQFGGGLVFQAYNLDEDIFKPILRIRKENE
jgi:hypothetical protein